MLIINNNKIVYPDYLTFDWSESFRHYIVGIQKCDNNHQVIVTPIFFKKWYSDQIENIDVLYGTYLPCLYVATTKYFDKKKQCPNRNLDVLYGTYLPYI